MARGDVELVPAFPGMELTHVQCLELCGGIMRSLGKLDEDDNGDMSLAREDNKQSK
eukprot:CAMPEP_0183303798 /NCGR_PEP_ID=MMETSP0160_2-20130417/9111_1 /TAXON_ID=2839 ORGANISM="Odontella Sinensis, Strain Grunow 1884" /NCGR_SAMPLE_ID=MMETSP0160_2 /ASSEMBLY_ACC=CAM_ASM_000250 /LENGTH=55 /DNA_ID=CAMNT_0025466755 /DNA_START=19 /DNA_END=186 /DNA_ORIENTATION=-